MYLPVDQSGDRSVSRCTYTKSIFLAERPSRIHHDHPTPHTTNGVLCDTHGNIRTEKCSYCFWSSRWEKWWL